MKLIGLTGGIGMGKSQACFFLREMGIPVVDTDNLARELVLPGSSALQEIIREFGPAIVDEKGILKRSELAKIVFAEAKARQKLEAILHPRIHAAWREEAEKWRLAGEKFGVVIIPLLFETNSASCFDSIICLACSKSTQLERLRARSWSEKHIEQRIGAQYSVEEKILGSHYVVWTDVPMEVHRKQLKTILKEKLQS